MHICELLLYKLYWPIIRAPHYVRFYLAPQPYPVKFTSDYSSWTVTYVCQNVLDSVKVFGRHKQKRALFSFLTHAVYFQTDLTYVLSNYSRSEGMHNQLASIMISCDRTTKVLYWLIILRFPLSRRRSTPSKWNLVIRKAIFLSASSFTVSFRI